MNSTDYINYAVDILKNNINYIDVDMSSTSAFYNLNILPFSILYKSILDLNNNTLNALQPTTMSSSQLDNFGELLFSTRRTDGSVMLSINIYLTNVASAVEPLIIYTTDQFKTFNNQTFTPIQDYIFAFNTLPLDETSTYRVATIIAQCTDSTAQIDINSISSSTISHSQYSYADNIVTSSAPVTAETDDEFLASMQSALITRNNINQPSIYTNIKNIFPTIKDCFTTGYGDPEMQRDIGVVSRVWSGHLGGMIDIFVNDSLTLTTYATTANLLPTNDGYEFTLRKYKGFDWYATDTASPNANSLLPWTEITGTAPSLLPVILFNWNNTTISTTGVTLKTLDNGECNYEVEILPDISYGKNYRYSIYENIKVKIYTNMPETIPSTISLTLSYYTLNSIPDIQNYINSNNGRALCSNNLVRSFIPVEIKDFRIVYDQKYSVNEATWKQTIADIINNWNLTEPLRFTTLFKDFPAPVRIGEIWNQSGIFPYTFNSDGTVLATTSPIPTAGTYPSFIKLTQYNIDGSSNCYISTQQLYPLVVSNGLSSTYRTCRYFVNVDNIVFEKGSW